MVTSPPLAQRSSFASIIGKCGLFLLALLAASPTALAQVTYTWLPTTGTNNWNLAANWTPGTPVSNAATILDFGTPGAGGYIANNNIAGTFILHGMLLNNTNLADAITLQGNPLSFQQFFNTSTKLFTYANMNYSGGGNVVIDNQVTLGGFFNLFGPGTGNITFNGPVLLNTEAVVRTQGNVTFNGLFTNNLGNRVFTSQLPADKIVTFNTLNLTEAATARTFFYRGNSVHFAGNINNVSTGASTLDVVLNPAATAQFSGTNSMMNFTHSFGRVLVNTNSLMATTGSTLTTSATFLEAMGSPRTINPANWNINEATRIIGFHPVTFGSATTTTTVTGADRNLMNLLTQFTPLTLYGTVRNNSGNDRTLFLNGFGPIIVEGQLRDGTDVSGTNTLAVSVETQGGYTEFKNNNTFSRPAFLGSGSLRIINNATLIASHSGALSDAGGIELQTAILNLNLPAFPALGVGRQVTLQGNGAITGDTDWTINGPLLNNGGNREFTVGLEPGRTLTLNGTISLTESTTVARTLHIGSSPSNFRFGRANVTINGVIQNGPVGPSNIIYSTAGTVDVNAANTYTGTTEIRGGTTNFNYSTAASRLSSGTGATTIIGGNVFFNGPTSAFTQNLNNTTFGGHSQIGGALASLTVNFGTLTRLAGGTADFAFGSTAWNTSTANVNGILTGFTVAGTDWATNASPGILPFTGYVLSTPTAVGTAAADNVDFAVDNTTPVPTATRNTIRFNTPTATTLTINAGNTLTLGGRGILVTPGMGSNPVTITGGNLTTDNVGGTELLLFNYNTDPAGTLTILSRIQNPGNALNLVKAGPGRVVLNPASTNLFTGTVFVNNGTLELVTPFALRSFYVNPTTGVIQDNPAAGFVQISDVQRLNAITFNHGSDGQLLLPTGLVSIGTLSGGVVRGNQQIRANGTGLTTLRIYQTSAQQFDGLLSDGTGQLGLYYNGTSVLTLSGNNTFSGDVTIAGGWLRIIGQAGNNYVGGNALGAMGKTITLTNDRATPVIAQFSYAGPYWPSADRLFTITTPQRHSAVGFEILNQAYVNFATTGTRGIVGGDATTRIFKTGNGVLDLTNNPNNYSGRWVISDGYLITPSFAANTLGTGDRLYLNGGGLMIVGDGVNLTNDRTIELLIHDATGTVSTNNQPRNFISTNFGSTLNILPGQIVGRGPVVFGNTLTSAYPVNGVVNITGAQNFGGYQMVGIAGSVTRINSDNNLGDPTNVVTLGPNAAFGMTTLQLANNVTSARTFLMQSASNFDTNGYNLTLTGESRFGGQPFTKNGQGTVSLNRITNNPYSNIAYAQTMTIRGGNLAAGSNDAFRFTVGAPISIERIGTAFLLNGFTVNTGNLTVNGDVDLGAGGTLNIYQTASVGSFGRIMGTGNVNVYGAQTWTLSGDSTYTGSLRADLGATISFTGNAQPPAVAIGIFGRMLNVNGVTIAGGGSVFAGTATPAENQQPRLGDTTAGVLTLGSATTGGGSFRLGLSSGTAALVQNFTDLVLNPGVNTIFSIGAGTGPVDVVNFTGNYIRNPGSVAQLNPATGFNISFTTAPPLINNVLPYAFNGNDFVTVTGGNVANATYVTENDPSLWTATDNITTDAALAPNDASGLVNSIRFNANATTTLQVGAAGLNVGAGGIMVTSVLAGTNTITIAPTDPAATLTSANNELWFHNNSAAVTAALLVNVPIVNGPTLPLTVTKSGAQPVVFSGADANTYTGATYVTQGVLSLNKAGTAVAIPGDLYILGGTVFRSSTTQIANTANITIAQNGVLNLNDHAAVVSTPRTMIAQSLRLGQGATITSSASTYTLTGANPGTLYIQNNSGVATASNAGLSTNITFTGPSTATAIFENYTTGTVLGASVTGRGGNSTAGSPVITGLITTNGLTPGMSIRFAGQTAPFTIVSVDSATQITVSAGMPSTTSGINFRANTVLDLGGVDREFYVTKSNQAADLTIASQIANGTLVKTGPGRMVLSLNGATPVGLVVDNPTAGLRIREGVVANVHAANVANMAIMLDTMTGALIPATYEVTNSHTLPTTTSFNIGSGGGIIAVTGVGQLLTFSAHNQLTGSGPLTFAGNGFGSNNAANFTIDLGNFTNTFSGQVIFDMSNPGGHNGVNTTGGSVQVRNAGSLGGASSWELRSGAVAILTNNQTYNMPINVNGYVTLQGESTRQLTLNGPLTVNAPSLLHLRNFIGGGFLRLTGNLSGAGDIANFNSQFILENSSGNNLGYTGTIYNSSSAELAIRNANSVPSASARLVFGRITDTGGTLLLNLGLASDTTGFTLATPIETYYGTHNSAAARLEIRVPANGRGLVNATGAAYTISGGISGTNGVFISGTANSATTGEVVLTGPTTHTGSASVLLGDTHNFIFGTGPGGLLTTNAFVRFDGQTSLPNPTGITNETIYLAALNRNVADFTYGYLFTGSGGGTTYTLANSTGPALAPAVKLLIGGLSNNNATIRGGVLGATDGNVTLRADVLIHRATDTTANNQRLALFTRDAGTLFTLGDNVQPVRFQPTRGYEPNDSQTILGVAINASATQVFDIGTATSTIVKRGEGTAVLGNVEYTTVAGAPIPGPVLGNLFFWQIGRSGADNTIASPFFDGAVRETTTGPGTGSLTGMNINLAGGVLESNDTLQGGGFTRPLGTLSTQVRWSQGGGGFAAFGGPLTVNIGGSSATLSWASTANFVTNNNALIFGSNSADNDVTFTNPIDLNGGTREVRVLSNRAIFTGGLSNSTGTATLVKTGLGTLVLAADLVAGTPAYIVSAGILQIGNAGTTGNFGSTGPVTNNATVIFNRTNNLTVPNFIGGTGNVIHNGTGTTTLTSANTYSGGTSVNAGLLAAGNISGSATGTGVVVVNPGGGLGGTGSISGNVFLNTGSPAGGYIRGDTGTGLGTLVLGSNVTINGDSTPGFGGTILTAVNRMAPNSANASLISLTSPTGILNLGVGGSPFVIDLRNTGLSPVVLFETYTINLAQVQTSGNIHLNSVSLPPSTVINPSDYVLLSDIPYALTHTLQVNGTGTVLQLTFSPVPEPSTILGVGALALGAFGYIRRRRAQA